MTEKNVVPLATGRSSRLIKLGIIAAAHGVRGEVKVRSLTTNPFDIIAYGPLQSAEGKMFELTITGGTNDMLIARIKGTDTRDAAERLRNIELFVPRSALPAPDEHEYYHEDLTGLTLVTESGERWGVLVGMHNFGAGDLASVRRESGQEEFLPFTRKIFTRMDFKEGICVIHPPEIEAAPADEHE